MVMGLSAYCPSHGMSRTIQYVSLPCHHHASLFGVEVNDWTWHMESQEFGSWSQSSSFGSGENVPIRCWLLAAG
jgi:hypothetical protein